MIKINKEAEITIKERKACEPIITDQTKKPLK